MNDIADKIAGLVQDVQDAEAQAVAEGRKDEQVLLSLVMTQLTVIAAHLKNLAGGI